MKFSINKEEFQNALSVVLKGVSTRSTLPVLSGILLKVRKDNLIMQATDLELSIQYSTAALIEEEGEIVVPGKLFSDIIKSLSDGAVYVEGNDEQASITCGTSSFSIKTLNHEDFPGFPEVATDQHLEIPFQTFAAMVKRVGRVVSRDESRAILTGVLITYENSKLRMVATDSYRLAITEAELVHSENPETEQDSQSASPQDPQSVSSDNDEANTISADNDETNIVAAEDFQAVISGSFLLEIASLPKTAAPVSVALAENQIVVTCGDTTFINRRLEGTFPNYKQLLPETYSTRAKLNVEHLTAGVKRASLLGSATAPVKIDLNAMSQTAQITAAAQDVGAAQEVIACEVEGEDAEIAFNHAYVLDGLSVIEGENVYLEVQSALKPGIFRAAAPEENYLYLVMPVRIS